MRESYKRNLHMVILMLQLIIHINNMNNDQTMRQGDFNIYVEQVITRDIEYFTQQAVQTSREEVKRKCVG